MPKPKHAAGILVTDFDGTMARQDFYRLILDRNLVAPGTPSFWHQYVQGRMTHFEALQATFDAARIGEDQLHALVNDMDLDPAAAGEISKLRAVGWNVVVASAGCRWYIDQILDAAGIQIEVHANPGSIRDRRLRMELAPQSRHFHPETGVDKAAIVQAAIANAREVAFAGDGLADLESALLVNPTRRFARGMLADQLTDRGESFQPFDRWSDVTGTLLRTINAEPIGNLS
jgi:2,3-diketo-5-methylthio-1-phosphopentane phosphatase